MINRNVNKSVKLPTKKPKQFEPLTIDEINRFLETARCDRLYALFLLDITTGMRKGEILGLRWENIDYDNKKIYIKNNLCRVFDCEIQGHMKTKLILLEPKTEKSKRSIPLKEEVIIELIKHRERQDKEKRSDEKYIRRTGNEGWGNIV